MGKQGPCRHCGVTSTPLWRNGPPEKPVLCNACGSRWRTKGSLANYTPLHVRDVIESDDIQPIKPRNVTVPVSKTTQFRQQQKKKPCRAMAESNDSFSGQNFRRASEVGEWNSNNTRSSEYSGSGATYSESCAQYDASEFTGSSQSNMWESMAPSSKKRPTGAAHPKPTRVEQLNHDLCTILNETPLSSIISATTEDLLLYPAEIVHPMDSTDSIEIGSGSILILNSSSKSVGKVKSKVVEEESEASSVPTDGNINGTEFKPKPRDLLQSEKPSSIHVARDSLLASLDWKEIINFECFSKLLTHDEQQKLRKYLSPADSMLDFAGLRSLFSSSQFMETLNTFQKLVEEEEHINPSNSGINPEEWKSLRRLVLSSPVKSEWIHSYEQIKEKDQKSGRILGKVPASGSVSSTTTSFKRPRNAINSDRSSGPGGCTMRSPKSIPYSVPETNIDSKPLFQPIPSIVGKENQHQRGLFLSPPPDRKVFDLPIEECSDEFSNEDLLLDIPRHSSFPEAELLKVIPNEESQSSCGVSSYSNKQSMLSRS